MSRYNAWQNKQLRETLGQLDHIALTQDRGAFFGSIFGTLNHLLWGDTIWMSRWCADVPRPAVSGHDSATFTKTFGDWDAKRFSLDGRIRIWAQTLSNMDLRGTLEWTYTATGQVHRQPLGLCVAHMFNHQTHHRGQLHQMMSAAGLTPPVSDLIFLPEEA